MANIRLVNFDTTINTNVTVITQDENLVLPRLIQDSGNNYRYDHFEGNTATYVYLQSNI